MVSYIGGGIVMRDKQYTALIFDVVESKRYENREEVQLFLKMIIQYCNRVFHQSLHKELMFSAGDEIQCLFKEANIAYICARLFTHICYPLEVRIGMGIGSIAYDNTQWNSVETDGEAYHNARDAIYSFHKKRNFGIIVNSNCDCDKVVNSLLLSSQLLSQQQSIIVQNIKLLTEFIFPIQDLNAMNKLFIVNENVLHNILRMRNQLLKRETVSMIKQNEKDRLKYISLHKIDQLVPLSISIDEVFQKSAYIFDYVWRKGMSTMLSEVLGTTRQNIDKHIKNGKIEECRSIDYSIAFYLKEVFDCD